MVDRILQEIFHVLIDFENGRLIAAPIAIIWGAEYGYYILIVGPAISLHKEISQL